MEKQIKIRKLVLDGIHEAFEEMLNSDDTDSWLAIHQILKRAREIVLQSGPA